MSEHTQPNYETQLNYDSSSSKVWNEHFTPDSADKIRAISGISSPEHYSKQQLEMMLGIAENPKEAAERLAERDVTVVITNRSGDYNGAFRKDAELLDDGGERTLFFETDGFIDIYRHLITLSKSGIQPSTLILSAHTEPGEFSVTNQRELIYGEPRKDIAHVFGEDYLEFATKRGFFKLPELHSRYSMHNMKGLGRFAAEVMKPSRAIDDDACDAGRKKIVILGCNSGTEVDTYVIEDDFGVKVARTSVVERLGEDLHELGVRGIDILGIPNNAAVYGIERGIAFSRWDGDRQAHEVPPLRVGVDDEVHISRTDEGITLHQAKSPKAS